MARVKVKLGKWNNQSYMLPDYGGTMEHMKGESLMLFGWETYKQKKFRPFYGIGIVYRVVKGDKSDLVYINFGMFSEHRTRVVVVIDNHSRRQILTLKRGQVCQVYGVCRFYTRKKPLENGEVQKEVDLLMFAKGLNGWYVPTMLDIKKMPINDNLVEPNEFDQKVSEIGEDILDQFMNGEE